MRPYVPMTKNAFILNFFKLYNILWKLALPFLKRNKRLKLGFEKRISSNHHSKTDIWIQAASAGEAYLAVNIIKKLEPGSKKKVLVTTMTPQGMDILKARLKNNSIHPLLKLKIDWFPFDIPGIIKEAVNVINPGVMILLETEIWPALLYNLKVNQTKILIINARLSKKSFNNYLKTKFLWKHLTPDMIMATSRHDAKRYQKIFEKSVVKTMPNIKFESIAADVSNDKTTRTKIKQILPHHLPLTILASVRKKESKDIIYIIKDILKSFPDQMVAIFPRHVHKVKSWECLFKSNNLDFHLRSGIHSPLQAPGIILWDVFGELATAYSLATAVFVGGSLKPLGGQNFIEPAIQGAVTITGPYNDDFTWATEQIFKKGLVIQKNNWKEISNTILQSLHNPVNKSDRKILIQHYLRQNQGGTQKACDELLNALKSSNRSLLR